MDLRSAPIAVKEEALSWRDLTTLLTKENSEIKSLGGKIDLLESIYITWVLALIVTSIFYSEYLIF